ncbi:MAG: helix-turn-helix transcriptional regulator [Cyanobacteriota bacterium]|nr:helix-turn-helix transcriptional regulator [Cyanobacteriota bacterium]
MSHPSPRARASRWLRQLTPGFLSRPTPNPPPDPLRTAGRLVRDAREAKGLGLRDLAQRTRISIAVLEALEGGWKDRLPEATYLRAMLPLLEHQLDLPTGSLEPLLPHQGHRAHGGTGKGAAQGKGLAPSTLLLLTTWQSGLLYGLLLLGLLYGVNLQQQRLAAMGRLVARPIPLTPNQAQAPSNPEEPFPDLRPLQRAAAGQAMGLLRRESKPSGPDRTLGLLTLSLNQPTRLALDSLRSGQTQLEGLSGDLSLPVLPPFELRLSPPPPAAAVRWRGKTLQEKGPDASEPPDSGVKPTAVYRVPLAPPPKPVPPAPAKTP